MPSIRKAARITGNHLVFRNADVDDSRFILSLRTDQSRSRFLSPTSPDLEMQVEWMQRYQRCDDQAYFIIEDGGGRKIGTIRLYDQAGDSFCWGSWIIRPGMPYSYSVESVLILYHYALDELGFSRSYFAIRKDNTSVWRFMERFGAERKAESDIDYFYETSRARVSESFVTYSRFLPQPVKVIYDPIPGSRQN